MVIAASFDLVVLLLAVTVLGVLAISPVASRLRFPLPALVLAAAAVVVKVVPELHVPSVAATGRIVSVALIGLLFNGGMSIGWSRLRGALSPILLAGVAGTFATAAAAAAVIHGALGFGWYVSALVATAVAPTDPAVVFSVLGRRRVEGRSGTILEGESGANDPVGIALMAGLIGAGGLNASGVGHVAATFGLQMAVGTAVGLVGGRILLELMRRRPLPAEGLYPLRTLAAAFAVYGLASVAHGSGFLAVFVAGIVVGDGRVPYKREIERFHDAVGSLGEIAAFVALGVTVNLDVLARTDVWGPGLLLGLALTVVIRPVVVGACLVPARLRLNELGFVAFAGLKGAVPILLGGDLLTAGIPGGQRLYGIVVVVVIFSVVVQGSLSSTVARLLRLPVLVVEPEPWSHGVRLRTEPDNVHRIRVVAGSPADGATLAELPALPEDAWVTLLVRDGTLMPVRANTRLEAGDTLSVIAPPERLGSLVTAFERRDS